MAFYPDGTYHFNPAIDSEDAALLEQANKMEHVVAFKQGQTNLQQAAERRGRDLAEALKEEGFSQAEADQVINEDPEFAAQLDKKLIQTQVKALKGHKGSKSAPPRAASPRQPAREAPLPEQGPYKEKLQKLREKGKPRLNSKGELISGKPMNYEDEMSVVDTLFQAAE